MKKYLWIIVIIVAIVMVTGRVAEGREMKNADFGIENLTIAEYHKAILTEDELAFVKNMEKNLPAYINWAWKADGAALHASYIGQSRIGYEFAVNTKIGSTINVAISTYKCMRHMTEKVAIEL